MLLCKVKKNTDLKVFDLILSGIVVSSEKN